METCTLCSFAPLAFLACVRMKTNIFTVVFMTLLVRPIPFPDLSISTGAHSLLSLPVYRPSCCSSSARRRPAPCGLCTSVLCCFSLDVRGCVPQLLQVCWNATAELLLYQLAFLKESLTSASHFPNPKLLSVFSVGSIYHLRVVYLCVYSLSPAREFVRRYLFS